MRNLSVLLVAALGLLIVGCKPGPGSPSPLPNVQSNNDVFNLGKQGNNTPVNPQPNYPAPQVVPGQPQPITPQPVPQNNNGGGLTGTWRADLGSLKMNLNMQQQPDPQQLEQMVAQIKQSLGAMSLTLNADGSYQASGSGQNGSGKYLLNGNSLQFQENNPSGQPQPQVTVSGDGSRLSLHMEAQSMSLDIDLVRG